MGSVGAIYLLNATKCIFYWNTVLVLIYIRVIRVKQASTELIY